MRELVHNHVARFIVYCTLALLSTTTIYGTFFVTAVYHQALVNKAGIEKMQLELADRRLYIARFEKVEAIQQQDHVQLERMADRMKDVVHMLLGLKIIKH